MPDPQELWRPAVAATAMLRKVHNGLRTVSGGVGGIGVVTTLNP